MSNKDTPSEKLTLKEIEIIHKTELKTFLQIDLRDSFIPKMDSARKGIDIQRIRSQFLGIKNMIAENFKYNIKLGKSSRNSIIETITYGNYMKNTKP